ncbi:MAG: signal peptide peptidase SppA [Pseudomonadota bacterium]
MTATSDLIIERRRVRRRLAFWRILAIVALVAVVGLLIPRAGVTGGGGSEIARVSINDIILDDPRRERALDKIAETDRVKALIVRINSPGGSAAASEALFDALRRVAEEKPVVAVMAEVAASGGYITALGADRIFAQKNTITGSIGVVAEIPNVEELLESVGIEVTRIKSGPLKAEPAITSEPSAESLAALETLMLDSFDWFRDLVAERRGLEEAAVEAVSDGRVFTGRQALEAGLIDAIGGERGAREWLSSEHDVDADLTVRDWRWNDRELPWPLDSLDQATARFLGLTRMAPRINGPSLYTIIH